MRRLAVLVAFAAAACGSDAGGRSGPAPGSDAERYCRTAPPPAGASGSDYVEYDGRWYEAECVRAYSWDAP